MRHLSPCLYPRPGCPTRPRPPLPQSPSMAFVHRRLLDLISGVASDANSRFARHYHWLPSRFYWNPPSDHADTFIPSSPCASSLGSSTPAPSQAAYDGVPEQRSPPSHDSGSRESTPSASPPPGPPPPLRVLTDCYNSDAMLEEDEKIRKMPRAEGNADDVEYAVLPLPAVVRRDHPLTVRQCEAMANLPLLR